MRKTDANLSVAMRLTEFLRSSYSCDLPRVAAILSHAVKGTNFYLAVTHYMRTTSVVTTPRLLVLPTSAKAEAQRN
jgi:hypothetical protein